MVGGLRLTSATADVDGRANMKASTLRLTLMKRPTGRVRFAISGGCSSTFRPFSQIKWIGWRDWALSFPRSFSPSNGEPPSTTGWYEQWESHGLQKARCRYANSWLHT